MVSSKHLSCIAGVAIFTAINCSSAFAGSRQTFDQATETVSVRIQSGDLDLSTKDGARELLRRIHGAAIAACESPVDPVYQHYALQLCVRDATDRAVGSVNNSIVTALNGGHPTASSMALASLR